MTIYDKQRLDSLHSELKDIKTINIVMEIETILIQSFEKSLSSIWVLSAKLDKIIERLNNDL